MSAEYKILDELVYSECYYFIRIIRPRSATWQEVTKKNGERMRFASVAETWQYITSNILGSPAVDAWEMMGVYKAIEETKVLLRSY